MHSSSLVRQFDILQQHTAQLEEPAVTAVAHQTNHNPFAVLVATLISLRTLDAITRSATRRLLSKAHNPQSLLHLSTARIAKLIYPAAFFNNKAAQLQALCRILLQDHAGQLPNDIDALLALPGIGRKSATLILSLAFGRPAICVDSHVHRIANRLGWIVSSGPQESEIALQRLFPRRLWSAINEVLVRFGIALCRPLSPFCSRCPLTSECPRQGVVQHR